MVVVAGVVTALATRALPRQQETLLVSVLLAHLHRGREATPALRQCRRALKSGLDPVPSVSTRILSLVDDYIRMVNG